MRVTLICTIHGRAQNLKQVYLFSSCCNRAGAAAAAVAASNIWDQIWKLIVLCYTILYPLPGPRLSIKVINHHQDATWDQETHSFFLIDVPHFHCHCIAFCCCTLNLSSEKIKILIRKLSHSHYTCDLIPIPMYQHSSFHFRSLPSSLISQRLFEIW